MATRRSGRSGTLVLVLLLLVLLLLGTGEGGGSRVLALLTGIVVVYVVFTVLFRRRR
jgi:hypothetical protein